MKTLEKDFKGTPGELSIFNDRQNEAIEVKCSKNGLVAKFPYWNDISEREATNNAKLFCASKEMAKVLEMAHAERVSDVRAIWEHSTSSKSLKEFTEHFIDNDPILKAIEQVLDKAL